MIRYEVAILGAGASGLVTSILLARAGVKVILIERQSRGGKKILASGNGRCNITNKNISKANFYARNSELIDNLIRDFSLTDIREFFKTLGLEIVFNQDGRAFPKSLSASSVLELLEAEVKRLNIDTIYEAKDLKVSKGFKINIGKKELQASKLILATGSLAAPQLGGNSSGLEIAKSFGHTIIEPLPALVPLESSAKITKALQGVKVEARVKLFVNRAERTSKEGDLLFTKYGVSGLSILDLSIEVAKALKEGKSTSLEIDFFKSTKKQELIKELKSSINKERNLPLNLWLGAKINPKLAKFLLQELELNNLREQNLNATTLKKLAQTLKAYPIKIDNLRELKYAEVALGGVDSKEIDSKNLESKKEKGLYFVGEILDVIGDRGGYNFTFAWYSAFRVSNFK